MLHQTMTTDDIDLYQTTAEPWEPCATVIAI